MPSLKTECTELSIGFGLLEIEPCRNLKKSEIEAYFSTTLKVEKYNNFVEEFIRDQKYYRRFYDIGLRLRKSYPLYRNAHLRHIQWEGPNQQAGTVTAAKDLIALNTPISIKASSDVVLNSSPYNLFVSIPQGHQPVKKSPNWYLTIAPEEYQLLYSFARDTWCPDYPPLITSYHKSVKKAQRLVLAERIKTAEELNDADFQKYKAFYLDMCYKVAKLSADKFNEYLAGSANNCENVVRSFFRIGEQKYILCGLDSNKEFAVEIPDVTTWKKQWRYKSLYASAAKNIDREQAVVMFHITLEDKQTRGLFELDFHDEIRWSHKRFYGSPEAKLYKDFLWSGVPFFGQIIKEEPYQKVGIMGEGGFGTVYKAKKKNSEKLVAYKELTNTMGSVQDHEDDRFRREVKIQSELSHPNIVPILDHDLSQSSPWFTMPLAQCNLKEMLEDCNVREDLQKLNNIYCQILEGIKYAHAHNIVHRDLKPENILLFENGQIKISDFGLGKQLDSTSSSLSLTNTSESMGSYQYAAPEQWQSFKDADFRSDIYALGKILYNCLTGEAPFPNLNLNLVDPCYKTVIAKCTEEDPNARFQCVDELLEVFKSCS